MKEDDLLIDEVREVRHRISERFEHDPQKLVDHYIEMQKKHTQRLQKAEESNPAEAVKI